ncbi:telomerase RNA component interacting RNase-like [Planococcus citri]|uniref:telomerase RNA component interacting RNase-like n=1 Tax=Planococcus citri TaxID=170843 RepID=UPI0031FA08AA
MSSRRRRRSPSSSSEDSNDVTGSENNKVTNVFRNDGSFLEMFKKMQKASQSTDNTSIAVSVARTPSTNVSKDTTDKEIQPKEDTKPKPVPMVGRRRCIKPLPVGKVRKLKADDEEEKKPPVTDAWAKYLEEVKKYKETYCDSEAKNRSLVK